MENMHTSSRIKRGFPTAYDPAIGLLNLMRWTLDEPNIRNINYDITEENFKLSKTGFRMVRPWVEPYLKKETSEQAARRLVTTGHMLANPGDLAGFLFHHPQEWAKWQWILAIDEYSRWRFYGSDYVVCAYNYGTIRGYSHWGLRDQVSSSDSDRNGVLVIAG